MQTLSCHCGHIRLEVDAPLQGLRQCNCSTCRRFGAIHWYVPARAVRLLTPSRSLSTYVWQFVHEGHHFCGTCGTSIMRTGYPDGRLEGGTTPCRRLSSGGEWPRLAR